MSLSKKQIDSVIFLERGMTGAACFCHLQNCHSEATSTSFILIKKLNLVAKLFQLAVIIRFSEVKIEIKLHQELG